MFNGVSFFPFFSIQNTPLYYTIYLTLLRYVDHFSFHHYLLVSYAYRVTECMVKHFIYLHSVRFLFARNFRSTLILESIYHSRTIADNKREKRPLALPNLNSTVFFFLWSVLLFGMARACVRKLFHQNLPV